MPSVAFISAPSPIHLLTIEPDLNPLIQQNRQIEINADKIEVNAIINNLLDVHVVREPN